MSNLAIKESVNVCGVLVPNISGGFGIDKRSMLAKHITEIHEKELKHVNEIINQNADRFKENIDIIDVKSHDEFVVALTDHNIFTRMQTSKANNIYLLSERGYAKLIKLFNDDKSWDLYDQLLDEYFELRDGQSQNNQPQTSLQVLQVAINQMVEQEKRLNDIEQLHNETNNKVTQMKSYLSESPDSKKIEREINNYSRKHNMKQNDVRTMVYNKIEDKYGIDIMKRVKNKRQKINEDRVNQGKIPYKESTLKTKYNGMNVIKDEGLEKDVLEILAGLD